MNSKVLAKIIIIKLKQLELLKNKQISEDSWLKLDKLSIKEEKTIQQCDMAPTKPTLPIKALYSLYKVLESEYYKHLELEKNKIRKDFMKR